MKVSSIILSLTLSVFVSNLFAQAVAENASELKEAGMSQETQQQLINEPDGCTIQIAQDGSYQIFARGTGTYDFSDAEDIQDATREAMLRAKANISKFLKETVASAESLDKMTKKAKSLTSDGQVEKKAVSSETVKIATESIKNSSEAILTGVITLAVIKQPGSGNGGEVQVTVGISSLTMKAAQATAQGINSSLNNRGGNAAGNGGAQSAPAPAPNKGYVRKSNSAF